MKPVSPVIFTLLMSSFAHIHTQTVEEMPIPSTAATITITIPATTLVTIKMPTTATAAPM